MEEEKRRIKKENVKKIKEREKVRNEEGILYTNEKDQKK